MRCDVTVMVETLVIAQKFLRNLDGGRLEMQNGMFPVSHNKHATYTT